MHGERDECDDEVQRALGCLEALCAAHLDIKKKGWKQPPPTPSPQRMINDSWDGHHCILLLLFGKTGEMLFCASNRYIKYMCIGMNPCAQWCACHYNAHCVSAVNQKTVPSQCKSGRLLIAFWRIFVIFLFLLFILSIIVCVSSYSLLFVSITLNECKELNISKRVGGQRSKCSL